MSEPHEDFRILLDLLQSARLDWLAQEVNAAVENARTECLFSDQDQQDEALLFPTPKRHQWTDADELETAIKVIYSFLVQPVQMWDAAAHTFGEEIRTSLVLVDGERTTRQPFTNEVRQYAEMFEKALAELWPGGPTGFYTHFHERNG